MLICIWDTIKQELFGCMFFRENMDMIKYLYKVDFLRDTIITVLPIGAKISTKVHVVKSPKTGVEVPFRFLIQDEVTSHLQNMLTLHDIDIGSSTQIRIYENYEFNLILWAFS